MIYFCNNNLWRTQIIHFQSSDETGLKIALFRNKLGVVNFVKFQVRFANDNLWKNLQVTTIMPANINKFNLTFTITKTFAQLAMPPFTNDFKCHSFELPIPWQVSFDHCFRPEVDDGKYRFGFSSFSRFKWCVYFDQTQWIFFFAL